MQVLIVYDGDCVLCQQYVRYTKLNAKYEVILKNARKDPQLVQNLLREGYDLNQGMVAIFQGRTYFAEDCIHFLALNSSRFDFFNKLCAALFKYKFIAKISYPLLKFGRSVILKVLQRQKISLD